MKGLYFKIRTLREPITMLLFITDVHVHPYNYYIVMNNRSVEGRGMLSEQRPSTGRYPEKR